jgi:hypothetical protein
LGKRSEGEIKEGMFSGMPRKIRSVKVERGGGGGGAGGRV